MVPFVVLVVTRCKLSFPGVTDTKSFQLVLHMRDILARPFFRMCLVFNRRILSRHAKRIPPKRLKNVIATHPFHPREHIADHVVPDMSDVSVSRRIRKHHQAVIFWLVRVFANFERTPFGPPLLPFSFDRLGIIVAHRYQIRNRSL